MELTIVLNKLKDELQELRNKIMNLKIFLLTSKFTTLNIERPNQGTLLKEQLKTMTEYEKILIQRIALIQDDIDNGWK